MKFAKGIKVTFVKKLALNKFLMRIDDVILREEVLELFIKIGNQTAATKEDVDKAQELLQRANISYEDFDNLIKQFRR